MERDHGEGDIGTGSIQTMGIVNAMKTGDIFVDMIIAMLIPVAIRMIASMVRRFANGLDLGVLSHWWRRRRLQHHRFIKHQVQRHSWGGTTSLDADTQNTVLLKAIQLFIDRELKLQLTEANISLTSMEDRNNKCGQYSFGYDEPNQGNDSKTLAGALAKYEIVRKPPLTIWHSLGLFGSPAALVKLQMSENEEDVNEKGKSAAICTTTYHFVSEGANAIDAFIDTAYRWYLDQLRSMEDNSRYLYDLKVVSTTTKADEDGSGTDGCSGSLYNRYRLSDEKTFESLFFRQKASLLKMIDNFTRKTGKYAVKGYPHKLGLLLHGPPGSGKTSLIKCLAQCTGRSIVTVPLAKISTNSELTDLVFNNRYHVVGEDVAYKLGFKDVIYVMEDVDAASKVVRRRVGSCDEYNSTINDAMAVPPRKSTWQLLLESADPACRAVVKRLIEKSERLKHAAVQSRTLTTLVRDLGDLPGLAFVGTHDENAARIGRDTIETVNNHMVSWETIDRFLSKHALSIESLLESGAEIDDAFVDEILGFRDRRIPTRSPRRKDNRFPKCAELTGSQQGPESLLAAIALSESESCDPSKALAKKDTVFGPSIFSKPKKDQLNLTGLLNVLDGVVDTPGRIVVMTTNHPEMLDPALIRPGRIDKNILLGYMASIDVISMLEHYYQTVLAETQCMRLHRIIGPRIVLTPAQLEQLTAESDTVEEMIQILEERAETSSSTASSSTSSTLTQDEEPSHTAET